MTAKMLKNHLFQFSQLRVTVKKTRTTSNTGIGLIVAAYWELGPRSTSPGSRGRFLEFSPKFLHDSTEDWAADDVGFGSGLDRPRGEGGDEELVEGA